MPSSETTTKFRVDISDLKKAMQEAKRSVAVANSEFKATSSTMDHWAKSTTGLKAKMTQLDSTLTAQKRMLEILKNEYDGLTDEQKQGSKEADNLKIKMNNQQAAINKTEKQLSYYSTELEKAERSEEIAAKEGRDATEVFDELGREAKQSGDDVESAGDGFTVFKGVISNLITEGIDLAIDKLRELGSSILETAEHVDDLNTNSKIDGVDVSTLEEWEYASKFIDVSVETMGKSMAKLTKNMTSSSSSVTGAFDALGIKTRDANGNLRDSNTVFMECIDALGSMTNETERDNLAMQIFGKSAKNLNPLIEAGTDELKAYGDEAHELGIVLTEDQVDKYQELNDAMDKIRNIGTGWIYDIGYAFIQGIDIEALVEKFEKVPEVLKKVRDGFNAVSPVLAALGVALTGLGITAFISNIGVLVGALKTWALGTKLVAAAQFLLDTALSMNPIGLIVIGIASLIAALVVLYKKNETFRNFINGMFAGIKTGFTTIVTVVKTGITTITGIFTGILNFIKTNWKSLLALLINPFAGLFTYFYNNNSKFQEFVDGAVNSIKQLPTKIATWLTKTVSKVSSWASSMANKGKQAGSKLVTAVTKAVKKLPSSMASIGANVVKGIWSGISNKNAWIKSKISSWVGSVKNWLKKFFKIGSPSRLMAEEIGQYLPSGIAMGVENNSRSLYDSLKSLSNTAVSGLNAGAGSVTGSTGYGGVVNNFNQTINSPKSLSRLEIYRQSKNLLGYAGGNR